MHPKGQVSLFIIIGLVLLAAAVLFFSIAEPSAVGPAQTETGLRQKTPQKAAPLQSYVEACMRQTGRQALVLAGSQGGFTHLPDDQPRVDTIMSSVAAWYDKGMDTRPTDEEVASQLSLYMDEVLPSCLNDFQDFPYPVKVLAEPHTLATITESKVIFETSYTLEMTLDDEVLTVDAFRTELTTQFGHALYVGKAIADMELALPDEIDPTFMNQFGMDVSVHAYRENEVVYVIKGDEELLGFPLVFMVSSIYDFDTTPENRFTNLAPLRAVVGQPFSYDFDALNESDVNFSMHTPGFFINRSAGVLRFTPLPEDVGNHTLFLELQDGPVLVREAVPIEITQTVPADSLRLRAAVGVTFRHSFPVASPLPDFPYTGYVTGPFAFNGSSLTYTPLMADQGEHFFEVLLFDDGVFINKTAYVIEVP
ncbi:MAG: hypothetical protein GXP63_00085 [DPANN group archaeon]|nr:hypothetical protein [DPANN group archaeon]